MRVVELRQQRGQLIEQARGILDRADREHRALTTDEEEQFQKLDHAQEALRERIAREEKMLELERELATQQSQSLPQRSESAPSQSAEVEYRGYRLARTRFGEEQYHAAWRAWLHHGANGLSNEQYRALSAGSDVQGGFTIAPQMFMATLLKFLDDSTFMRQIATVLPPLTNAATLGQVTLDADPGDFDWTAELMTGSEDSTMAFGKREMRPWPLAKRIKVSKTLMRISSIDIETVVRQRLGYKLAVTQEKAYLTGTGVQRPLGVFVASNDGIPTSRDVSSGNTATSIGADGLINAKYSIKPQYWPRLTWIFHRDAVKQIHQLKYGDGHYIWQPGLTAGAPDRILDIPYRMSEFAPNTFTSGAYVGIIGDFSYYWIVDSLDMQMQRLLELYAETNQEGFIARYEGDGMPVLAEAFARVKLA